jgi:hypothetical protein
MGIKLICLVWKWSFASYVTVDNIDGRCLIMRPLREREQRKTGENWAVKKLITCIKKRVRWVGHIAYMGEERSP